MRKKNKNKNGKQVLLYILQKNNKKRLELIPQRHQQGFHVRLVLQSAICKSTKLCKSLKGNIIKK